MNSEKGANSARNYAFSKSSGKYIQWLDSDDLLLKGKFESQVDALEASNDDIAYSDFRFDYYNGAAFVNSEVKKFHDHNDYLEELLKDNWNASHSYLLKRGIALRLDQGNGWNPETKVGQDREYYTMAGILGAKFRYVSGTFAVYNKRTTGTISGMKFKERLEQNQILEKRFRTEIQASALISGSKKKTYQRILNTHQLKACFYHSKISLDHFISPFEVKWSLMHWKMRIAVPFILIYKNLAWLIDELTTKIR